MQHQGRRTWVPAIFFALAACGRLCATTPAWGQTPTPGDAPPPTAPPTPPDTNIPPAGEQPQPAAPNYDVQWTGTVDGYYAYQFHGPKKPVILNQNVGLGGTFYLARQNSPTLALVALNVFKNAPPGGVGFKTTLITGDTADINSGGIGVGYGAEARYKNIQQLFVTYAFPGGGGADFGRFYTPLGFETTEPGGTYNYTRGLNYTFLPGNSTGLRVYSPSLSGLIISGYIVRTVLNSATAGVEDDNGSLGYLTQLNYTAPSGKFNLIGTIGFGKDRANYVSGDFKTNAKNVISDVDFVYNFSPTTLGALQYSFGDYDPDGGGPDSRNHVYAAYFRNAFTPTTALALRFSYADLKTDATATAAAYKNKPYEFTATYEIKNTSKLTTRLEYRHDSSDLPAFADGDSNFTKKSQDTALVALIFSLK